MPARRAPRHRRLGRRDERLHLDQQRARALEHRHHDGSRDVGRAVGEEQRGRVGHLGEPVAAHLEDAELGGRAEAVLDRVQEPQPVVPIAVERQHRVDDVLQRSRPRERTVLRDVADEDRRQRAGLRDRDECRRALAHLHDRAGHARHRGVGDRLDRVDGEHVGLGCVDRGDDLVERVGADEHQPRVERVDALGAHAHLLRRLLGADEQAPGAGGGEPAERLEEQRALAHPRLAADEGDGAGDQTTAEDAVELVDARGPAGRGRSGDGVDGDGRGRRRTRARGGEGCSTPGAGDHRLDECAPGAALGTTPEPAWGLRAALATPMDHPGLHEDDVRIRV